MYHGIWDRIIFIFIFVVMRDNFSSILVKIFNISSNGFIINVISDNGNIINDTNGTNTKFIIGVNMFIS